MAQYQVAWNATTRVATVQALGDALPVGSVDIGHFEHADVETFVTGKPDFYKYDENHVFYHHVRDFLYKLSPSVQDMQRVSIAQDIDYIPLVGITIDPGTVTVTVASPTQQLTITKDPVNASNGTVTWVSSDPTKATVSSTGLVTRVTNGTTTITATSVDGAHVATRLVTVTA